MNRKDIVIGGVLLLILAGAYYFYKQRSESTNNISIPETPSIEESIEKKFNYQIPENVEKAELKDVSGGDASAVATKDYEDSKFSSTFLADLPDLEEGTFYQAWLIKGNEGETNYSILSLGKLSVAKGGWMINFQSSTDYSDYDKVMVTKEKVFDKTPEEKILEGEF